jgi:hypothetical protein
MMKKLFVPVCLSVVLTSSLAMADRQTFDETKTRIALPLPTAPVIDGVIDLANESWNYAAGSGAGGGSYWTMRFDDTQEDFVSGAHLETGIGPIDGTDFGADIYVGYDNENLYVAVRKIDDLLNDDTAAAGSKDGSTWQDDSVEVFVDGDNSNYAERDTAGAKPEGWSTGGQYVLTINNAYREAEAGSPGFGPNAAWYAQADINANGDYEFEFRISLSLFGNPKPGDIIGFDIAINDDDSGGASTDNQYAWAGNTHVEATYGNLVLGPRTYTAPSVTTAPTVNGTISAGEYGNAKQITVTTFNGNYDVADSGSAEPWLLGDHDFNAWVVHNADAIYVAVDVTDDMVVTDSADAGSEDGSTWIDDSVEIFFDSDNSMDDGRTAANLYEGQFVFTPNGAWRDAEANNPLFGASDDWFAASSTTSTGYQVEFVVQKGALFEPKQTMGFDLAVNDDADRKTQIIWNGRPHNERSYGKLTLASDGGTSVSEWSLY